MSIHSLKSIPFSECSQYILSEKDVLTYFYHAYIYYLQGDKSKGIEYIENKLAEYVKLYGEQYSLCEHYRDALRKYKELK